VEKRERELDQQGRVDDGDVGRRSRCGIKRDGSPRMAARELDKIRGRDRNSRQLRREIGRRVRRRGSLQRHGLAVLWRRLRSRTIRGFLNRVLAAPLFAAVAFAPWEHEELLAGYTPAPQVADHQQKRPARIGKSAVHYSSRLQSTGNGFPKAKGPRGRPQRTRDHNGLIRKLAKLGTGSRLITSNSNKQDVDTKQINRHRLLRQVN